jgi:14-3-3 protein
MGYREAIFTAKLCERAERFDEMAENMKEAVRMLDKEGGRISFEDRNLLSVAFKNSVGMRRTASRVLAKILTEESKGNEKDIEHATKMRLSERYLAEIKRELFSICDELLGLLDMYLLKKSDDGQSESQVFFLKMKGDYLRYKAEVLSDEEVGAITEEATNAYLSAMEIARETLPATNPTRLGLILNCSVFYFEIRHEKDKAVEIGSSGFDEAIAELDSLSEEGYKDSTLIMQLLRDNLSLWAEDMKEEAVR